ncbi:MAG: HDOD domain-containing protein [Archangium sp.]|nr:HDOD domain-containing protein [Archangium sp.]
MTEPSRLLLVDDERAVLEGLKKALRPHRAKWTVDSAIGGAAALEALATHTYDAIVSDARMPEVDGESVMRCAAQAQPTAVRVILSGQVDARTGHRLASLCHQFLAKPTDADALIGAVEDCRRLSESLGNMQLRALVGRLQGLPVAPRVYHRIANLIEHQSASTNAVAEIIETDLALVTRLLRSVNSAAFGMARKVGSVREAVTLLGLDRVREVVLLVELFGPNAPLEVLGALQARAVKRSKLARLFAGARSTLLLASESALLVDVGAVGLACAAPERYRALWNAAPDRQRRHALELEQFGATSLEVGAVLLGLWGMPSSVVNAVRWSAERPAAVTAADPRAVTALCVLLEDEADGAADAAEVDALAAALGVTALIPGARDLLGNQSEPEGEAA